MNIHRVVIKDRGLQLVREGILSIYSKWVKADPTVPRGAPVIVETKSGEILGYGFYENVGAIGVRLLGMGKPFSTDPCEWIASNIDKSKRRRSGIVYWGDSYRLVNADADFLPGVIIDLYRDLAVIQSTSIYADKMLDCIAKHLYEEYGYKIYVKNTQAVRREIGLTIWSGPINNIPHKIKTLIREGKALFEIDVEKGQKTGFYLDQALNRLELAEYITGGENVLDLYSYTGAFSIHMLLKGAENALLVDESPYALRQALINSKLNNVEDRVVVINTRVENFLNNIALTRKKYFDVIIIDPPNLTPKPDNRENALVVYEKLAERSLQLIRSGGIIAVFSCSFYISEEDLLRVFSRKAREQNRQLFIINGVRTAAPDHLTRPVDRDLRYLKGYFFRIE